MAEDFIILEGKKLRDVITAGLEKLDKEEDEVDVDILEEGITIAGISIRKYKIKMAIKKEKDLNIKSKIETNNKRESENSELDENKVTKIKSDKKRFDIVYKEDGVYLSIDNIGNLKPNLNEVTKRIKIKEINEVDYNLVKETIDSGENAFVKIAPEQEELLLDSRIETSISKDKMKGYMTLHASEGGKQLSSQEIIKQLKEEIKFGLDENIVINSINERKYGKEILVAEGVVAVDGNDGYIDYKFKNNKENSPYILEDGSVDFRNLDLITNVVKGDLLAELNPASPGSDGFNVLGERLNHKPGLETSFNYGVNVSLSQDEIKLTSDIDGQVCIESKKIIVYELLSISKDVDNSTGNIDFNGNVKIEGSVLTGFKVEAKGNIEIDGSVEGAVIECGGDLIIKRGVQGYNTAVINSGGNIVTKYIENAEINCGSNIESEAIMHSQTVCKGIVTVGGKKGLLVGGSCKASEEISAKVIGSNMATATVLEVGLDPSIRDDQEELIELKKSTKDDIDKFNKMVNHLTKIEKEIGLDEEKKDMLNKSIVAKLQLEKKAMTLKEDLEEIDERIKCSSNGKIKVREVIYSGVRITIGNSKMTIREKRDHCIIYRDKEDYEIKIGPFEE